MTPPWFATYLAALGWALLACARLVPVADVGGYFRRFMAWAAAIAAGASLALVVRPERLPWWYAGPAAATALAAGVAWTVGRRARESVVQDALLLLWPASLVVADPLWSAAHVATGAAACGAVLTAMILGHWYLVNARLPFALLVRLCRATLVALGVKAAVTAALAAGLTGADPLWETLPAFYRRGLVFEFLMPLVRIAVGFGVGGVLTAMALSCAKIRSNQSATGILYVAVGIILIGEMTGLYLTFGAGIPV